MLQDSPPTVVFSISETPPNSSQADILFSHLLPSRAATFLTLAYWQISVREIKRGGFSI
jgi:hypothetical protein